MQRWVVLCLLVCPAVASAYELTGGRWFLWKFPNGVPYCLVMNASDATTTTMRSQFTLAIDDAMAAWTQAGGTNTPGISCSDYTVRKATCSGSPNVSDSQPWVYWETAWDAQVSAGRDTIGVTFYWIQSGEIQGAKTIFNDQYFYWSTDNSATDVGSIAVHEFGHFIGLDHYDKTDQAKANDCYNGGSMPSVMCAAYVGGEWRVPTADDRTACCYLYPNAGIGSSCSGPSDCTTSLCHADGYCTAACPATSCPTGYTCTSGQCARDSVQTNCPGCGALACQFCTGSANYSFCTQSCGTNNDCPLGFFCAGAQYGCWPMSWTCGTAGFPGAGEPCYQGYACALGSWCPDGQSSPVCFTACKSAADCPAANPCVFDANGLGYCGAPSPAGCPCDATTACDGGCACDPECQCDCDKTTACDKDCDSCDPECGGCFSAALLPSASGSEASPLLATLLLAGALGRRLRRRSL